MLHDIDRDGSLPSDEDRAIQVLKFQLAQTKSDLEENQALIERTETALQDRRGYQASLIKEIVSLEKAIKRLEDQY